MAIKTRHLAKTVSMGVNSADRGPSPSLWKTCPFLELANNPRQGFHVLEDFTTNAMAIAYNTAFAAALSSGTTGVMGGWVDNDSGLSVSMANSIYGEVNLGGTASAANSALGVIWPKSITHFGPINLAGNTRLWFEARVTFSNVSNAASAAFIGLAQTNCVSSDDLLLDEASSEMALASKSLVGFYRKLSAGSTLDLVYRTSGSSAVTVKSQAASIQASTAVKLGMTTDGTRIYFWVNGKRLPDSAGLADTGFPDGVPLGVYIVQKLKASVTSQISVDWIRIAQRFV